MQHDVRPFELQVSRVTALTEDFWSRFSLQIFLAARYINFSFSKTKNAPITKSGVMPASKLQWTFLICCGTLKKMVIARNFFKPYFRNKVP